MKTTCTLKKFTSNEWANILPKMFFKSVTNDLNLTELSIQSHHVTLWAFTLRYFKPLYPCHYQRNMCCVSESGEKTMGLAPPGGEVQLQHCVKTCQEHSHCLHTTCKGSSEAQTTEDNKPSQNTNAAGGTHLATWFTNSYTARGLTDSSDNYRNEVGDHRRSQSRA